MNIKFIANNISKVNNISINCIISKSHTNLKKNTCLLSYTYNSDLIFEYLINISENKINIFIYLPSFFVKKFHPSLIGVFILDYADKIKCHDVSITSDDKNYFQDIIFGFLRKDFIFNKYLSNSSFTKFKSNFRIEEVKKNLLDSLSFLKKLVSEPSNIIYPESFSKLIVQEFRSNKNIKTTIHDKANIKKMGLNCLLSVSQGSVREPRVIEFSQNKKVKSVDILFVGKGVCFDSGGISIKPSSGMEDMKWDMAGAAVVSAIIKYLSTLKNKFTFAGIIGLVENMPSGTAYKPGDIIKSYKGINVEVLNTDAEGRLVLADIISYGCEVYKPRIIIDFATLTGAIMIALGQQYAGLYSNDNEIADLLYNSGIDTNEKVWRMPLHDEFDKELNSPFVDLKNISNSRYGGSITAAQFLKRFIPKNTKWAHLDIAGVTWNNNGDLINSKGATGFGLTLISDFIDKYFQKI